MAIRKTVDHKGLTVSSAYIRVESISGGKNGGWHGNVAVYATESAANPKRVKTGQKAKLDDKGAEVIENGERVFEDVFETRLPQPLESFGVHTPYVSGQDPYPLVYSAAKAKLEGGEDC